MRLVRDHIGASLLLLVLLFTVVQTGCHVAKFVPENEKLYTGATVTIEHGGEMRKPSRVKSDLEGELRPRPNGTLLGGRLGLWAYFKGSRERSGFLTRFLNKKLGEEPVYLSDVEMTRSEQFIANRLENQGHYFNTVSSEVSETKHKASIAYTIQSGAPYTLATYQYVRDSGQVDQLIRQRVETSLLQAGDPLNLNDLKEERGRISGSLRKHGYFNFSEDLLIFRVDTNQYDTRRVDLFLDLKSGLEPHLLKPYQIENIYVHTDYTLDDESAAAQDTTLVAGIYFIEKEESFHERYLRPYITLAPKGLFSTELQSQTNRRLSSMGSFKYVTTRFDEIDTISTDLRHLDATIYLSQFTRHSVSAEVQAVTKSNNFAGPGLILSYKNKNLFGGGEIWKSSINLAYETQFQGGNTTGLNSYEIGFQNDIILPRVIAPFKVDASGGYSVPKTKFGLGYSILDRVQFYRLTSIQGTYGFFWQTNRYIRHDLTPISLNFTNTANVTDEFQEILDANPFLEQSFENQFIPGLVYGWQFNERTKEHKRNKIFVQTQLDVAGSLTNLISQVFGGAEDDRLFGRTYAKYVKTEVDFRYYMKMGSDGFLVWRGYAGVGAPYGNAQSLPYIKQYFSGGPSSIRAFRVRSLGPGSYRPPAQSDNAFFDQTGDIKLETNLEYRFTYYKYFKGALFVDAGNVWLFNENESIPGGQWSSHWLSEIAIGAGTGIRLDVDFLVLRLDLGIPLRKPFLDQGERWIDRFDITRRAWRRENMIWNLAIGYPF
ncbi:MAG: BamA/TamA family outer membrane protein [Cyclobacteriaceae bacterium]